MRYDWGEPLIQEPGTCEYFEEIDDRFFGAVRDYMPWKEIPFDNLIDYQSLRGKRVLEIGVGHGSHAQLLAEHSGDFLGIDLSTLACQLTSERLRLFGCSGHVANMDAERMGLPDGSVDFVWSWGVIHHSADTSKALLEAARVLKPGGSAVIMVYVRHWFRYIFLDGLLRGLRNRALRMGRSLSEIVQEGTDGAIARMYTPREWTRLCQDASFDVDKMYYKAQKSDVIPLPQGSLKKWLESNVPDPMTRFLGESCGLSTFLISKLRKK